MAYTTIDDPTIYFNTKLYTGTGSSNALTGVGFQPDWVWIKQRSGTENHNIFDSVRTATKRISSNRTNAEDTQAQQLTAFGADGFTVGTDDGANKSSSTYVAWNWKAGGSASSNSNGSTTTSVSASTTSGFSIATYTGTGSSATIGHGLSSVPQMIIVKRRDSADGWFIYHHSIGNGKYLRLETTDTEASSSNLWGGTDPTSSVFTVNNNSTNGSSRTFVTYCFAEKKGYSKFGSYTGNNNTDGAFVYTGFKPAWVMMKATTASEHWNLHDNKRDPINVCDAGLKPNENNAEEDADRLDFVSNGFKHRSSSGGYNSSITFIYMAFAESPFVNSNGVPNNAR